jgi:hypothetical protein
MIRSLRQQHRQMLTVISFLLPVAFATGIAARKPAPTVTALPAALAMPSQHFEAVEWERADLFTKTPLQVRLLRERAGAGRWAVALSSPHDFLKPDLIVYWVAGSPNTADKLPDNARLLGVFNPSLPLPLPIEAISSSGVLVFYSLADHEIVETSKRFELQ